MTALGLLMRQRLTRLAILLVAVVQVGAFVAPHSETLSDASSSRPHLHAVGDALEFAHDEAACPACNGIHFATKTTATTQLVIARTVPAHVQTEQQAPRSAARHYTSLSRAPPATV